jgi:hypothetical protein
MGEDCDETETSDVSLSTSEDRRGSTGKMGEGEEQEGRVNTLIHLVTISLFSLQASFPTDESILLERVTLRLPLLVEGLY